MKLKRDEQLVQAAKRRAELIAWLNNNQGWHKIDQLAEVVGSDAKSIAYIASRLVASKLIKVKRVGVHKMYSNDQSHGDPEQEQSQENQVPHKKRKSKEIELMMDGVLIVVGRNDRTGRLRITITEE